MAKIDMAKLNMTNMNTLFKKGYLLAGVIMAANMFVGNEMKASQEKKDPKSQGEPQKVNGEQKPVENVGKKAAETQFAQGFLNFVLTYENTINLIGELALSGANNYFKWWDYNPGGYLNLRIGCLGWRSKRLLDIFQFEVNLNGIRGALWLIPGAYNFIKAYTAKNCEDYLNPLHVSFLVCNLFDKKSVWSLIALIGSFLLQGFVSMPLTLHLSNFSISISLDSMIWGIVGMILEKKDGKENKEDDGKEQSIDTSQLNN